MLLSGPRWPAQLETEMQKNFKLPVGAGLTAAFSSPIEAALGTTVLQKLALAHVMDGNILRLEVLQGADLLAGASGRSLCEHLEASFDPTAWYGVVTGLPFALGPFDRKSQAMNGLALTLMGIEVEGVRVEKTPSQQVVDRLVAAGCDRAVALEVVDGMVLADEEAQQPKPRFREQLISLGVPEDAVDLISSHLDHVVPAGYEVVAVKGVERS